MRWTEQVLFFVSSTHVPTPPGVMSHDQHGAGQTMFRQGSAAHVPLVGTQRSPALHCVTTHLLGMQAPVAMSQYVPSAHDTLVQASLTHLPATQRWLVGSQLTREQRSTQLPRSQ